jgi:hypothetical protein
MNGLSGVIALGTDNSISWHADTGVVLGPITIQIGSVTLVVDAAFPDVLIDFAVTDAGALSGGPALFDDPEFAVRVLTAGDGEIVVGTLLAAPLVRVATVAAVGDIHLGDLDEATLLLDRAHARALAGDVDTATELYLLTHAVTDRIVEQIESADYTGPLVAALLEALDSAPQQALDPADRDLWTAALRDRRFDVDGQVVEDALFELVDGSMPQLAITLGDAIVPPGQLVDLRAVPPRILEYTGPDDPDLDVVDRGGRVVVQAALRADAMIESAEVQELFAVAAEEGSGDLLAVAPCTVAGGVVTAELTVPGMAAASLRCALIGSGTDPDTLRMDRFGISIARIDRYCRHAWTLYRTVGAMLAGLDLAVDEADFDTVQQEADETHDAAVDAVQTALGLAAQLRRRNRSGRDAAGLAAYLEAIQRFGSAIAARPPLDGPTGVTLTELLAVTEL